MVKEFTVLDKRTVAADEAGNEMAWYLRKYPDDPVSEWVPQVHYSDGKTETPVWMPLPGSQYTFLECPIFEALFEGTRGPGKAIENNELVLTDKGWCEVGAVTTDHQLVAPDGTYTKIKGIYPHESGTLYRMTFDDGCHLDTDGDHRWLAYDSKNCRWRVKTTNELRTFKNYTHIPLMSAPAPGPKWEGYDPYIIGLMVGDGTMSAQSPIIYNPEDEIRNYLIAAGWQCYDYEYRAVHQLHLLGGDRAKELIGAPREKGDKKYIPKNLLMADPESRLATLQGLMDSDGHCDKEGRCEFKSVSYQLAQDVQYLARSLGGKARVHRQEIDPGTGYGNRDHIFRVKITHAGKFSPFRLTRHVARINPNQNGARRRIVSIEQIDDAPATCFEVQHPSHLFVCQDFIVTHNTLTLIMDFAKEVGKGHGKAWRGVLFRQKLGDLDDVVRKIEEWMYQLYPGFRFRKSKADYSAVWPSGEELLLRHMEDERTYGEYHGHEYPWIGWEELTQWPTDKAYKMMMSCCRPPKAGVPTRIRATTNPYGPGHNWVKRRFQLPQMRGRVVRRAGEMPRVAIHGTLSENFLLLHDVPNYPMQVREAAANPAQAEAWLAGSWDVTSGGMIDDIFDRGKHVLPPIPPEKIPSGWTITRAYDHGQTSPYSVGWFLESNGEPINIDGRLIGNVRGDIILWQEWYGTKGGDNEGVVLSSSKIAAGIFDREVEWGLRSPTGFNSRVYPGPADTEIFNKSSDRHGRCPADDMADKGIDWERADKSSGSRKRGWLMLRSYLEGAVPDPSGFREKPGFFVCGDCFWWLELCPPMPRDEKDQDEVPSAYEDHCADMTRYRLTWELPGMSRRSF